MAQVVKRIWRSGPRKVKKVSWGYTLQLHGKQVRKYDAAWSQEDAQNALAAAILDRDVPAPATSGPVMTFGQAVEQYVKAKARKKSVASDQLYLNDFKAAFGADTPVTEISAAKISAWKADKLAAVCERTGEPFAAASVNRPLAALRHLLVLAHEEWGVVERVPKIRLEKEPEGRIRWLEPDEEAKLLAACRKSRNHELPNIVTIALETGLRKAELLDLTWDRVDLSRGLIRLEVTKSGKRREVPMRQVVYSVLAGLTGREGRLFRTRSIRTAFENAVAEAKLDDFHFHDCRHSFASWFVMGGGSLQALKEILGHASLTMTMRYAHLAPEHLRTEIAKTERQAAPVSTRSAQSTASDVGAVDLAEVTA